MWNRLTGFRRFRASKTTSRMRGINMVLYKKPLQGQQFRQRWHDIAHSQHGNGYQGHHHCSPSCLGPQNRCLGLWHPWSVWKIYWPAPHSQNKQTKTWRGLHPGTQQVKHCLSPCLKHPHGWPDLWWRVPTGCRWSCQVPTAEIWHQHCGTWQRREDIFWNWVRFSTPTTWSNCSWSPLEVKQYLIYIALTELVVKCITTTTGIFDHHMIVFDSSIKLQSAKQPRRQVHQWPKAN